MMHLTEQQKAYLAGLLDGDGSIGAYKAHATTSTSYNQLRIRLVITHKATAVYINKVFGGKLQEYGEKKHKRKHKVYYVIWSGQDAVDLAKLVKEYSIIKKAQFELAVQWPVGRGQGIIPCEADIKLRTKIATRLKALKLEGLERI